MLYICPRDVAPLGKYASPERLVLTKNGSPIAFVEFTLTAFQAEMKAIGPPPQECEVPEASVDWVLAAVALQAWLRPLKLSESVSFRGKTVPFFVEPSAFFPLYFLANRLSLTHLEVNLEISLYSFSFPVLKNLFLEEQKFGPSLRFPQLHFAMLELFKLLFTPDQTESLKSLEFAEVVFELRIDPTDWLLAIHEQFWKSSTRDLYRYEIKAMVKRLQANNAKAALAVWLFAPFFGLEGADSKFAPFVENFPSDFMFRLLPTQISWLVSQLPVDKTMAHFASNIENFSLKELMSLLPIFEGREDLVPTLMRLSESDIFPDIAKHCLPLLTSLPWGFVVAHFDFAVCFKWLKLHAFSVDPEIIPQFLDLISHVPLDSKIGFYLLALYAKGWKQCLDFIPTVEFLCDTLTWIIAHKRLFQLSSEAVSELRLRFDFTGPALAVLLGFLARFEIYTFDTSILFPISAESFWPTVNLVVASSISISPDLLTALCEMAAPLFSAMTCSQCRLLSTIIHFDSLFRHPSLSVLTEDFALYYASCCVRPDFSLINIPHLSFRMICRFAEFDSFEFEASPDSPVAQIGGDVPVDVSAWCALSPPRIHFFPNVAVLDISPIEATEYDFEFIGISDVLHVENVSSVQEKMPLIIWQSSWQSARTRASEVIMEAIELDLPLFVNAAALKTLRDEGRDTGWPLDLTFSDDLVDRIDWVEPPGDFRPEKENLPLLEIEGGMDRFFGSVPCHAENQGNAAVFVEMRSGKRLFAAKFKNGRAGVFNFDLVLRQSAHDVVQWGCRKQALLALAWLLAPYR
jgi:hypothetical protein